MNQPLDPQDALGVLVQLIADAVAARVAASPTVAPAPELEPWRLYGLEEAAAMLGRSTRWVRDRVKDGALGHVRLDGGALAFELEELQRFARERRIDGRSLAPRLQRVRGFVLQLPAPVVAVLRLDPAALAGQIPAGAFLRDDTLELVLADGLPPCLAASNDCGVFLRRVDAEVFEESTSLRIWEP